MGRIVKFTLSMVKPTGTRQGGERFQAAPIRFPNRFIRPWESSAGRQRLEVGIRQHRASAPLFELVPTTKTIGPPSTALLR